MAAGAEPHDNTEMRTPPPGAVIAATAALHLGACAGGAAPRTSAAEPWPEAEKLFHSDHRWRGGDAAYSVDLGDGRTLWLFGDSFVARPGSDGRRGCAMVRNSIAVQTGADPATALMSFSWRGTVDQPASWIPEDGDVWHWPLHGLRVGDAVTVFCTRVQRTAAEGPFGFRAVGWTAFRITGVDGPVDSWRCARLPSPATPFDVVVGTSVLTDGSHVLAYALREPGDHAVLLVRWERDDFARGELGSPEWHDGGQWRAMDHLTSAPAPVLAEGAPEFTVCRRNGAFVMVQTIGFGATDLGVRTAPRPEGPWSEPTIVFRPPESDLEGVFVYAGKAHAHVGGGDLLATYAANAWDFGRLVDDTTLYFPRCVRIRLDRLPSRALHFP